MFFMTIILERGGECPVSEERHPLAGPPDYFGMSTLFSRLHTIAYGRRFALAFPLLGGKAGLGRQMTIFSPSAEELDHLVQDIVVQHLIHCVCTMSGRIHPVPVEILADPATSWTAYLRDRSRDNCLTPSAIRRSIRRGLQDTPRGNAIREFLAQGHNPEAIARLLAAPSSTPYLTHTSRSNGNRIKMGIVTRPVAPLSPGQWPFDSFGLSRGGGLPSLPVII